MPVTLWYSGVPTIFPSPALMHCENRRVTANQFRAHRNCHLLTTQVYVLTTFIMFLELVVYVTLCLQID